MVFKTTGNKSNPVILFFHAMGVIGESSMPVAEKMAEKYYCIMPTSTVYCPGQRYHSKRDEIQQIVRFLENHGIKKIELVVASSIGADLAMAFLTEAKIPVKVLERKSTNCGNNITYMKELIEEEGIVCRTMILSQDATII